LFYIHGPLTGVTLKTTMWKWISPKSLHAIAVENLEHAKILNSTTAREVVFNQRVMAQW